MISGRILNYVCCLYLIVTQFNQTALAFTKPHESTIFGQAKRSNSKKNFPFQTVPRTSSSSSVLLESSSGEIEGKHELLLAEAINLNTTCASAILSEVDQMRKMGASRDSIEQYLDNLLSSGPDATLPFWARSKRLARFSRRARMASLRRTLDITTPPPSESEDESDSTAADASQQRRRRRAFMALLRALESEERGMDGRVPSIVSLEKKATQDLKEDSANLRNRLPEGLETPEYEVLSRRDSIQKSIEIRRYKPYSTCAVSMDKPRPTNSSNTDAKVQMPDIGGASSFGALAGYLFGKNDKSTAMKMTTPVFTSTISDENGKQMEFVLPSEYWNANSLSEAPQPLSGSGVTLQQKESEERAVLLFGGYASKKEVEKRKKELAAALSKDLEWKEGEEAPTVAQYNDPFTVPWRRVNEVSIKVVKK